MKKIGLIAVCIAFLLALYFILDPFKPRATVDLRRPSLTIEQIPGPLNTNREPVITARPNFNILAAAHRGAQNYAPENTLPAIQAAIDLNVGYIELDIRYSSDGVPVIMHDRTLDRTTDGSGPINRLSLQEIRQLDAGSWFHKDFQGEKVPTLEEALQLIQGKACVVWDIKSDVVPRRAAIELLQTLGFGPDCLLVTFGNIRSNGLRDERQTALIELWPDAPIMPIARDENELRFVLNQYPHVRALRLLPIHMTNELIDMAHAAGLLTYASTVGFRDNAQEHKKYIDAGVDILMLDNIAVLYEQIGKTAEFPPVYKETIRYAIDQAPPQ